MLQIKNVSKSFGNIHALQDISLNIEKGEFFGLLGPNGAGKSTLINLIVGYLSAYKGEILYNDEKISTNNIKLRAKIGYVPQEIALFQQLTAEQNLKIFGSLYGLKGKELKERISKVFELVQLSERKKDRLKNFSGGMKRRINLAVSLLHEPEILLCDEPTVGVDPQSRLSIFEMLQDLNKKGMTIIYTTHYMEEAERLCKRMAILDFGKIIGTGTLNDILGLLEHKETVKIYKTAFTVEKFEKLKALGEVIENELFYEVNPTDGNRRLSKLFTQLEDMKIPNNFIEVSKASLEDVFITLTGRSLRD